VRVIGSVRHSRAPCEASVAAAWSAVSSCRTRTTTRASSRSFECKEATSWPQRPVAQNLAHEAKLAVQHIITDARRVGRDELTFEVLPPLSGGNRRGSDIATALDGAVDALVREGLIVEAEGFSESHDKQL